LPNNLHAHDKNNSIIKFVRENRSPTENANDTWHLTKGLARNAKKITFGSQGNKGKIWHEQLADKAGSIKTHVYYSMKNCRAEADTLRTSIMNLVHHYQGNHNGCNPGSRCQNEANYIPTKVQITDPNAEKCLLDFLQKLPAYKQAEQYRFCLDTHYVESFNNAVLQYVDKIISFGQDTYLLRINLGILDWNENVDRPKTSVSTVVDITKPRQKTGKAVHKAKTFNFRDNIWKNWMNKAYGII